MLRISPVSVTYGCLWMLVDAGGGGGWSSVVEGGKGAA